MSVKLPAVKAQVFQFHFNKVALKTSSQTSIYVRVAQTTYFSVFVSGLNWRC